MNSSNRLWNLILIVSAIMVLVLFVRHATRSTSAEDKTLGVSETGVKLQMASEPKTEKKDEQISLPAHSAKRDIVASTREWREGRYEVLPSDAPILVLENSYERKTLWRRETSVVLCSFDKTKSCVVGPGAEMLVTDKLPEFYRSMRGRMASPNILKTAPQGAAARAELVRKSVEFSKEMSLSEASEAQNKTRQGKTQ